MQPELAEVGKLVKIEEKYKTGQMFLHRLFGYRGIVLFPWTATLHDRDKSSNGATPTDECKAPVTFYQVSQNSVVFI